MTEEMQNAKARILVVDDDPIIVDSLSAFLRLEGYEVETCNDGSTAIEILSSRRCSVVISDVNMTQTNGLELLRAIKQHYPDVVVIFITGYGTIENAVEAVKLGAFDYMTKPVNDDEIRVAVEKALKHHTLISENQQLRQKLELRYGLDNIVGHDYKMLRIYDLVEAVADSRTTVLMTGESGTGKSMIARAIHHRSPRRDKPFVEISCGAIPESLLESELFGHTKGSFTGATADKPGRFLAADGGTIFLDEINSASQAFQVKLLRVLQERKFEPVGSNQTISVDTRVVLATNQDLAKLVENGTFRQDLYYRINVVNIVLPPLRERLGDIPLLAQSFLDRFTRDMGRHIQSFSPDAMDAMMRYNWPGNVRELENLVERAVVLSKRPLIMIEDLPPQFAELTGADGAARPMVNGFGTGFSAASSAPAAPAVDGDEGPWDPKPLKDLLEEPEKKIIIRALKANGWNRQITAQQLDINRTTLYKKMKRYGLITGDEAE